MATPPHRQRWSIFNTAAIWPLIHQQPEEEEEEEEEEEGMLTSQIGFNQNLNSKWHSVYLYSYKVTENEEIQ